MATCGDPNDKVSEQFKYSLGIVLKETVQSKEAKESQKHAELLLEHLKEEPVILFTKKLVSKLNEIIDSSFHDEKVASHSKKREKVWIKFHQFRSETLPHMWTVLWSASQFSSCSVSSGSWLCQMVARCMMELILKEKLPVATKPTELPSLSIDEQNALRYAGGFVMVSIKRKSKSDNVIKWINQHLKESSDADSADSYLDYTKIWLRCIDRGGLFHISDLMFQMIISMEVILRKILAQTIPTKSIDLQDATRLMKDDEEIMFYWSLLSVQLDDEIAQSLLKEIIRIWITIRGFSYTSSLLEEYKRLQKTNIKKKPLRKELQNDQ